MLVVDAGVFVDQLLGHRNLFDDGDEIHAPAAVDLEVLSAWRRMVSAGIVTASQAREAIDLFGDMGITRHEHLPLLTRVWQLRHDIAPFDASYVALAESLGAILVTTDRKLARTAQRYCDVVAV
jgi:predicted nucleic acid-binding protein